MAGKQIKHIRIETKSVGAKEAQKELAEIDVTISDLNKSITSFTRRSGSMGAALTSLTKRAGSVNKNLTGISAALKSVNAASAGTAAQTKKLDGYITNLEVLNSVLTDLARSANLAEAGLDGINATAGMKSLIGILEQIETNTGKASARIKEARDNITDLDVTTGRAGEELEELARNSDRASKAQTKLGKTTTQTTNAMRQTTKAVDNQTKSFSALAFGANPLVSAYAAIAVNVFAIGAAFDLLNRAASFDRLQDQLNTFSAAVSGLDVSGLAEQMREASAGALTLRESLSFATKGTAFNFSTKQLTDLTEGARKASIALGIDFTDAMDRVLRGISKQEIELFDELGVITRLTPAFQAYADSVGKSVKELTDYERQLALTIEVQSQLDEKFSGIEANATAWETLSINVKDSSTTLLVFLSRALTPVAEALSGIIEDASILSALPIIDKKSADQAEVFADALSKNKLGQAINSTAGITDSVASLRKEWEATLEKIRLAKIEVAGGIETNLIEKSINGVGNALGGTATTLIDISEQAFSSTLPDSWRGSIEGTASSLKNMASDMATLQSLQKLRAAQEQEILELQKAQVEQVKLIAATKGVKSEDVTSETAGKVLAYTRSLDENLGVLDGTVQANSRLGSALEDTILKFQSINAIVEEASGFTGELRDKGFNELKKSMKFSDEITNMEDLIRVTQDLDNMMLRSVKTAKLRSIAVGSKDEDIENQEALVGELQKQAKAEADLNLAISAAQRDATKFQLKFNTLKLEQLKIDRQLQRTIEQKEVSTAAQIAWQAEQSTYASDILKIQIESLAFQVQATEKAGKETTELDAQLALLRVKLDIQKQIEARERATTNAMNETGKLQTQLGKAGSEKDKVVIQQQLLDIRKAEVAAMVEGEEKLRAQNALARDQAELDRNTAAAPFQDASSTLSAMASMQGVTDLQSATLGIAGQFSDVFAEAAQNGMEGFAGFTEFLSGNMEAFQGFAQGVADGIGSVYQASSDARVAGIDEEIAAEKRRDGKSAESLAKIKELEKKKIKEQAKAKKAQVIISTASAIAMSFAELGPIAGIPAAAMMAGMGVLQIAAINKAANGQIAGLDTGAGGGSDMKIEGGNRRNDVDVSRNANAGELSFINGGSGQGSINNFVTPGRAGGGTSSAGASIVVGERGAEEITPLVPVSVSPAGSKSSGGGMVFSPVFHVEALDSAGFEAVTSRFSVELFNSLETELRARNLTLDNLA